MKDKMKPEKTTLLQSVDGVKSEPNLDVEFKKEPVLSAPLCDNESKNSNLCSKVSSFFIIYFSNILAGDAVGACKNLLRAIATHYCANKS